MRVENLIPSFLKAPLARLRALARDRRGVAAIEFAFLAPLLLTMYFVTMEIAPGIDSSKKVGRAASMIADLITQQQSVSDTDLNSIMAIGEATLRPYGRTKMSVYITAIQVTDEDDPEAVVVWSRKMIDGAYSRHEAFETTTNIPPALKTKGSFLIRVTATLKYTPMIAWTADEKETTGLLAAFDKIDMSDTYYLRPRVSPTIPCTGC